MLISVVRVTPEGAWGLEFRLGLDHASIIGATTSPPGKHELGLFTLTFFLQSSDVQSPG